MTNDKKIKILIEAVIYDPDTGRFISQIKGTGGRYGKYIGNYIRPDGYIRMSVKKISIYAHVLAWICYYKKLPENEIDHIDTNRSNNKINNLREGTRSQNGQNKRIAKKTNRSGLLGVKTKNSSKYRKIRYEAQIGINNKDIYIGTFDTAIEAHEAYLEKKKEIHEFSTL